MTGFRGDRSGGCGAILFVGGSLDGKLMPDGGGSHYSVPKIRRVIGPLAPTEQDVISHEIYRRRDWGAGRRPDLPEIMAPSEMTDADVLRRLIECYRAPSETES